MYGMNYGQMNQYSPQPVYTQPVGVGHGAGVAVIAVAILILIALGLIF